MRFPLLVAIMVTILACKTVHQEDSFLWLEDIEGKAQLDWVRTELSLIHI